MALKQSGGACAQANSHRIEGTGGARAGAGLLRRFGPHPAM